MQKQGNILDVKAGTKALKRTLGAPVTTDRIGKSKILPEGKNLAVTAIINGIEIKVFSILLALDPLI